MTATDMRPQTGAWRRGSVNALQRVTQRVEAQDSTPAFLAACVAIISKSFEALGDTRTAEVRAALREPGRAFLDVKRV